MKFYLFLATILSVCQSLAGSSAYYVGKAKLLKAIQKEEISEEDPKSAMGTGKFTITEAKQLSFEADCPKGFCGTVAAGQLRTGTLRYPRSLKPRKDSEFFFRETTLCGKSDCDHEWEVISQDDFNNSTRR